VNVGRQFDGFVVAAFLRAMSKNAPAAEPPGVNVA